MVYSVAYALQYLVLAAKLRLRGEDLRVVEEPVRLHPVGFHVLWLQPPCFISIHYSVADIHQPFQEFSGVRVGVCAWRLL